MFQSYFLSFFTNLNLSFAFQVQFIKMMENNRVKCTIDNDQVKLLNKDTFDIVDYIESDIKLRPLNMKMN